jgi:hypothetical protein
VPTSPAEDFEFFKEINGIPRRQLTMDMLRATAGMVWRPALATWPHEFLNTDNMFLCVK